MSIISVKRAVDFNEFGWYDVTLSDGRIVQIARDAGNTNWWTLNLTWRDSQKFGYADDHLGFTKSEALAYLEEKLARLEAKHGPIPPPRRMPSWNYKPPATDPNPGASLIGLGKASELEFIRLGAKKAEHVSFPHHWWAWSGGAKTGTILLVKPLSASQTGSAPSNAQHMRFHAAEPRGLIRADAPDLTGVHRTIGRAVSLTYDARGIDSDKNNAPYIHHFGAMTHAQRPPFPESAWPEVVVDRAGRLFLRRKPGNTYRLDDWIRG